MSKEKIYCYGIHKIDTLGLYITAAGFHRASKDSKIAIGKAIVRFGECLIKKVEEAGVER